MNTGRVDVHTHLLPGIDDGCSDFAESIAAARALTSAGYTHAFCTPHVWPSLAGNNIAGIGRAVAQLQVALDGADVPLKVFGGGELNLMSLWPAIQLLGDNEIVTYGLNSRYVLFDFWSESWAECKDSLEAAVVHLTGRGFKPVLAHPERIVALQRDAGAIDRLTDLGVLLQLNSWCLVDAVTHATTPLATRLLKEGRYFLIGTDLHKPSGMEVRIRGVEMAEQIVGKAAVEKLTHQNPQLLI